MTRIKSEEDQAKIAYFKWLYSLVVHSSLDRDYWLLCTDLHKKEYHWTVPNDDNRGADGLQFRDDFSLEYFGTVIDWYLGPATFFEVLVGLAHRMSEIMDAGEERIDYWFLILLTNLNFNNFIDDWYLYEEQAIVKETMDRVLDRGYSRTGKGGLFPLKPKRDRKDQRLVEIWYQMQAFLQEM
jgi:hypothetical protein